jgi:hypothetical protein
MWIGEFGNSGTLAGGGFDRGFAVDSIVDSIVDSR